MAQGAFRLILVVLDMKAAHPSLQIMFGIGMIGRFLKKLGTGLLYIWYWSIND